ncbi:MAG: TetR/AcrR family transcriptional regulator [Sedimentisphaerales bacterium]|nr:TetR/AcrR family transcriptional regulator [Sedimentisphaerales bacterium]
MAKGTRGKRTRSDILQTASRLFALNGYFHTSTSDILESVSISKGAFYHHFKSKEDLALAILEQLRRDFQELLIEPVGRVEPEKRPGEMLDRIVALNQSGQWFNCLLIARLVQEMSQQEGELAGQVVETVNWLIGFWREIISDAQTAGSISRSLDPRIMAELIFAAWTGAIICNELDDGIIHLEHLREFARTLLYARNGS